MSEKKNYTTCTQTTEAYFNISFVHLRFRSAVVMDTQIIPFFLLKAQNSMEIETQKIITQVTL